MSDINLVRSHSLSIAKAKALVQRAADGLATEYDLESEWLASISTRNSSGNTIGVFGDESTTQAN
jgi:hypothetical protein